MARSTSNSTGTFLPPGAPENTGSMKTISNMGGNQGADNTGSFLPPGTAGTMAQKVRVVPGAVSGTVKLPSDQTINTLPNAANQDN